MKLSICIATFKRADFIAQTLDAIVAQMSAEVEVVVVDGASPDDTPQVLGPYVSAHGVRYYRETENCGVDRDYDKAVAYARGEYCWLMTDDDLLAEGAIERVLTAIDDGPDLVVVNAETRDKTLTRTLQPSMLPPAPDHEWGACDTDAFMAEAANLLTFIGGVVVRRSTWMDRERATYYGSLFIHVGVIFQQPGLSRIKIITAPLVLIRYGNAMWMPRGFEIWTFKWPALVWSFPHVSEQTRATVCPREPWRNPRVLLYYRAIGAYTPQAYRAYLAERTGGVNRLLAWSIACIPLRLANLVAVAVVAGRKNPHGLMLYDLLRAPWAAPLSLWLARVLNRLHGRA